MKKSARTHIKLWWPHNEAVIASLMFYKHTGNEKYAEIFEKVVKYAFDHFSDPEYGERLGYLHRDGTPTLPLVKTITTRFLYGFAKTDLLPQK